MPYSSYLNKKLENVINHSLSNYKFILLSDLIEISKNQYIKTSENINIDHDKLKSMLMSDSVDNVKLLVAGLRDKDLTEYLSTFIESYFLIRNVEIRSLIRNKILKNYKVHKTLNYDSYSNDVGNIRSYVQSIVVSNLEINNDYILNSLLNVNEIKEHALRIFKHN
jgi:hypothetical protein